MPAQPVFDLDDPKVPISFRLPRYVGARFRFRHEFTVEGFEPTELAVEVPHLAHHAAAFIELVQLQDYNAAVWVAPPQDVDGHAFSAASLHMRFHPKFGR